MKPLLKSAIYYKKWLDCNVVFERIVPSKKDPSKSTKVPIHTLKPCEEIGKDLYEEKQTIDDIIKLYNKIKHKKPTGIGLLCNLSKENMLFLDFDEWRYIWRTKEEGMKWFAQDGRIVYETPRGFRVLILLDERTRRFGDLEILYKDQHIGEGGGVLSLHKWTMPPSYVIHKDFYYRFLVYDFRKSIFKIVNYPWEIGEYSVSWNAQSVIKSIEESLGIRIVDGGMSKGIKRCGKHEDKARDEPRCRIEVLDKMSDKQIIAFLVLIFRKVNKKMGKRCVLEKIFMEWFRSGKLPIKKYYGGLYRTGDVSSGSIEIEITYRMLMLNTIAGILRDFGMNLDRIEEFLADNYRDLDGEPDDSVYKVMYAVRNGRYDITMKGECPWCIIYSLRKPCSERPLSIARRINCEEAGRLARIVMERVK